MRKINPPSSVLSIIMWAYILKRLLGLIPVLLGITLVVFCFLHIIPGDPVTAMLGERATPEQIEATKQQLGLNRPLPAQYLAFLSQLVQLKLGSSLISGIAILDEIKTRWPATCELAIAAMLLALILGIPAGIIAALQQNRWPDYVTLTGSLVGASFPVYWLGLLLIYLFAVNLRWFPPSGRLSLEAGLSFQPITGFLLLDALLTLNLPLLIDGLAHLALPAFTLATIPLSVVARITRTALLDTLSQPYISTARSKGLAERTVILRHALKNALLPIVTVLGLQFGTLLGGAVLTETIFSWPGIGFWLYEGILTRDYPVILNGVVLVATVFVLINLVTDLCYTWIDPRIKPH